MDNWTLPHAADPGWPVTPQGWVALVARSVLPVLPTTRHALERLARRAEDIDVHRVTEEMPWDPLFVARLFGCLAQARGRHEADVATIGRAILMLGIGPFLRVFEGVPAVSIGSAEDRRAHRGLVRVIRRARRAATFAYRMAAWRNDVAAEEIAIAALLDEVAEMLVWLLAPQAGRIMQAMQAADAQLRSRAVQKRVLGFELEELQWLLIEGWRLPQPLVDMMREHPAAGPRGRNVKLAADLARHSACGWSNAALPDDFRAIAEFLVTLPAQARVVVGAPPALEPAPA
ncbi:MAG: HDOD domain-containing protein [Alphaproteobacteria bacterium]|nr:HDOD domain-containing protein [Alphaproteobacteria bacterium]